MQGTKQTASGRCKTNGGNGDWKKLIYGEKDGYKNVGMGNSINYWSLYKENVVEKLIVCNKLYEKLKNDIKNLKI